MAWAPGGVFLWNRATGASRIVVGRGGYAEFSSDSTRLVYGALIFDTDRCNFTPRSCWDIWAQDLATRETSVVSVRPDGQPGNGDSALPHWIPGTTQIVYQTEANDLGGPDTNSNWDIYLATVLPPTES